MKKVKLVKGNVKRVIAVASAFMMTCSTVVGTPFGGVLSAYANQADAVGQVEQPSSEEAEMPNETEAAEENTEVDETEAADESTEADETEAVEESTEADETEAVEESTEADGTEAAKESTEADETEVAEESTAAEESTEADESEGIEESKPDDATAGNGVTEEIPQKEQQKLTHEQVENSDMWYVELDNYIMEDEHYYAINEETGDKGELLKEKYIEIEKSGEDHGAFIIYVDKNGNMVKKKWLEVDTEEGRKFRYINSEGKVLILHEKKIAGGFFGDFDWEGFWTPCPHEFFDAEIDGGDTVIKYSDEDGKIAAVNKDGENLHYYFFTNEEKETFCGIMDVGNGTITDELAKSTWISDLWIGEDGKLTVDVGNKLIDGKYYVFDKEGHGALILDALIRDEDGNILCYIDAEGNKVTNQFATDTESGDTYYFGEDGSPVFRQWIKVDGKFRYVDAEGHMIADTTKAVGGHYGHFDQEGYWTAIEHKFFDSELESGASITRYAAEGGEIAGIGDMENRQYYCFEESAGNVRCRLMAVGGETVTDTEIKNLWIDDLWVNADGNLITRAEDQLIGDKYYNFDDDGHSTLITSSFILDADNNIVCYVDADGTKVISQEEYQIEDKYYSFDENGHCELVINSFIHDEDGNLLYYVNEEGIKVTNMNAQKIGDKYYNSNNDGIVELITNEFIYDENSEILCYVGADGTKVINVKEQQVGDKYYRIDAEGTCTLITSDFIHDAEGNLLHYVNEDGDKMTNAREEKIGDKYYNFDGEGIIELITNSLVHDESGNILCYVGADGMKAVNIEEQLAEDKYYKIDGEGHCQLITDAFIHDAEGNNLYYVDADGAKVIGEKERQIGDVYYNIDNEGRLTLITNAFIHGIDGNIMYYVNETGLKVTDKQEYPIENRYYNIDGNGYVVLIKSAVVRDAEDKILCYVDENGDIATNRLVTLDDHIIYFGEDGTQVFRQWIQRDGKYSYIDDEGYMIVNKTKAAAGSYGHFDQDGYWTAIENTFFESKLDSGATVMRYAAKGGEIAGIGEKENRQFYCFEVGADGTKHCRLMAVGGEAVTDTKVTNTWIGDLWVNDAGNLSVGVKDQPVGDKFYDFDEYGHSKLITNALIYANGKIVCYVNGEGNKVTKQFVNVDGHTVYFGADGAQAFRQWIKVGEKYRYVDKKGYMIVNSTKAVGRSYGHFDSEGYWTAIEDTFFETELENGDSILLYSGKEGVIAGIGDNISWQNYGFMKGADGSMRCRLLIVDGGAVSDEAVMNLWIDNMRVNETGYLIISADAPVDGVYYHFDADGHGALITYKVSYVLGGGTNNSINPTGYTGAMDTIILSAPSRNGYNFTGWYTDSSFKNKITEIKHKSHGDLTLYAAWSRPSSNDNDNDNSSSSNNNTNNNTNTGGSSTSVTVTPGEGQNVTVKAGDTSVLGATSQTSEGSVSGNTIVSTTQNASVPVANGQTAQVATIAVGKDGSTRTLLASQVQGATVQQKTIMVQGVPVQQNVVVYTDGTQVSQKSGAAELDGFTENAALAEKAIQDGTKTLADTYNGKVSIDLQQYKQVGAAVTYEVTAGANGAVPQVQMEQTSFAPGQEIAALITDANGNVTAVTIVVGDNGVIQYQIPGVNCIVRFMSKA